MKKKVIIGLCGGRPGCRSVAVQVLQDIEPTAVDVGIGQHIRVPWGRSSRLKVALRSADADVLLCGINCLEEAQVVEAAGGFVVHIDSIPSEEVPIRRDSILMTLGQARGRYVTPPVAMMQCKEKASRE
ncbi:MAG: hypothetical protein ACRC8D_07295 [Aeromonas sp.]